MKVLTAILSVMILLVFFAGCELAPKKSDKDTGNKTSQAQADKPESKVTQPANQPENSVEKKGEAANEEEPEEDDDEE